MKNAVYLKNVSFSFSERPVLEDVNLTIKRGDFASIVGPNGGGKTTFLKLLLGLQKPDSGEILVLGRKPAKSRFRVGYMPQHANLDMQFPVTVMDVVLMGRLGRSLGGRYSKKDREAAAKALSEVEMSGSANHMFRELSGGQRQRVLIARALCCEPELLLLDEPTSNVDPEMEEAFLNILTELNQRMTILMASHDLGFVSQVVKSVI
ncbi:MAG: ABC transporter ATP-binding protein, partial [Desulfobulbaceae bacterium]|nr:ABC transporter ATP-binding protein [Desulfobulbaceae bacterium]